MNSEEALGRRFERFAELIARLRGPGGCPWDREQTHASLKPMTIEEAYEVLEAIDAGDARELAGELGDLLLQVVFHAQIAAEDGRFDLADVVRLVAEKMVRRHPHVFGDQSAETSAEVLRNWEVIKQEERRAKGQARGGAGFTPVEPRGGTGGVRRSTHPLDEAPEAASMLDSVSPALPAVMEAFQLTTKTARVGFDWPNAAAVLAKLREELDELEQAVRSDLPTRAKAAYDELGDVLFSAVNVARLLGSDPESALKAANRKFRRRFRFVEERLREQGRTPADSDLREMDALWDQAKASEG